MNSNEFYNELKQLTTLGYLEQAQLERIQDEYIKTRKEHHNAFLIFALIGVVFIGAGVISLFAYNWSMFSREMKAFIAFLPLLGVQVLLFLKIRAQASEVWIQSLSLALGIAFLSALGLIYQAYQISYSLQSMLLTGFVLMLPVVYLLDGYYLALLYMAGICWTGWNSDYILLASLLLPYYIKCVRKDGACRLLSLCFFIWMLYLAILYVPYGAFYACILILLIYMTIERPALYPVLAGRMLYVMLFTKAVFYLFFNNFTELFGYGSPDPYFYHMQDPLLLALLAGAFIRIYVFYKKKAGKARLDLLLSVILCGLLTADLMVFPYASFLAYEILVNLCLIAFSLYKLLRGIKSANLVSVRRYTAAIILYIVLKVSLGNYQLLIKGIVFLIAGLAFLAVNYRMTLKLKGGNVHENTPQ
ncbi:DUF2157 domain-containing protein [Lachnoclostridium pacaense]|uniref:DUF2157 domain-containing protein n=1 Tax=Enterocloster hominis (ex Hitch et al. 2024) TaxID=1917870 RepID=UPI001D0FF1E0|nr:DUF2157 domain-containing protein [Lachnoclostridium pacaense]MCC2817068.1 DUF2157 domain-containing protein [Lachnoclostridium pacaense]